MLHDHFGMQMMDIAMRKEASINQIVSKLPSLLLSDSVGNELNATTNSSVRSISTNGITDCH